MNNKVLIPIGLFVCLIIYMLLFPAKSASVSIWEKMGFEVTVLPSTAEIMMEMYLQEAEEIRREEANLDDSLLQDDLHGIRYAGDTYDGAVLCFTDRELVVLILQSRESAEVIIREDAAALAILGSVKTEPGQCFTGNE